MVPWYVLIVGESVDLYILMSPSIFMRICIEYKESQSTIVNTILTINILNGIDGIQINHRQREAIYSIFDLLDRVQPEINGNRKRMINIKFVLRMLFQIMGLPYNEIKITKSKKTLQFYEQWWKQAYGFIKNDIRKIITRLWIRISYYIFCWIYQV